MTFDSLLNYHSQDLLYHNIELTFQVGPNIYIYIYVCVCVYIYIYVYVCVYKFKEIYFNISLSVYNVMKEKRT